MVRINALDTPYAYRDIVEVVEAAGDRLDLVMMPKAESARDVVFVDTLLVADRSQSRFPTRIGIEAQIETARGFLYTREIASAVAAARGVDLRCRAIMRRRCGCPSPPSASAMRTTRCIPATAGTP